MKISFNSLAMALIATAFCTTAVAQDGFAVMKSETPIPGESLSRGWQICNQSSKELVKVIYNIHEDGKWVKKGWRNVRANNCAVILTRLNTRYVYYYAEAQNTVWKGGKLFCAHPTRRFSFSGKKCPEGYELYDFIEVDTRDATRFTTRLVD